MILKSWDYNSIGVVKLWHRECCKEVGANNDHSKSSISNLFANFKRRHIMSIIHIWNWCWRKVKKFLPIFNMLLQRGNQMSSQLNTIEAMAKDVGTVEFINAIFNANEFPFVLVCDP